MEAEQQRRVLKPCVWWTFPFGEESRVCVKPGAGWLQVVAVTALALEKRELGVGSKVTVPLRKS